MSDYLYRYIDNKGRKEAIDEAVRVLRHVEFDAIAVRGVSGLLVGPAVAMELNKKLVVVRKSAARHSCCDIETDEWYPTITDFRYVILDDFVCSGATVGVIMEKLSKATCVGVFQYASHSRADKETYKEQMEVRFGADYPPQIDNGANRRQRTVKPK